MNNENQSNVLLSCGCGCGEVLDIRQLGNQLFISWCSAMWYQKQISPLGVVRERMKYIFKTIKKRRTVVAGIVLDKSEVRSFLEELKRIDLSKGEKDNATSFPIKNASYLRITVDDDLTYPIYAIELVGRQGLKDAIFRPFEVYDIVWDENRLKHFISNGEKVL